MASTHGLRKQRDARSGERRRRSKSAERQLERESGTEAPPDSQQIQRLQASAGNQTVQTLYDRGELQAKLEVSSPTDPAEREARQIADAVAGEPASKDPASPTITRSPRTTSGAAAADEEPERQLRAQLQGGRPLPAGTRPFFEARFGRDFSDVRVHTDRNADEVARSVDARAFTLGTDVVFADGAYDPGGSGGRKLLAHELTHVVQQRGGREGVQRYMGENPFREDDGGMTRQEQAEYYTAPPGAYLPEEGRDVLEGIGQGIISFPIALGYFGWRWWDSVNLADQDRVLEVHLERERATRLIGKFVRTGGDVAAVGGPLVSFTRILLDPLVREVVDEYLSEEEVRALQVALEDVLDSEEIEEFQSEASDVAYEQLRRRIGVYLGNSKITKKLLKMLLEHLLSTEEVSEFTTKIVSKLGLGPPLTLLSWFVMGSATLQKASLASRRLAERYPTAYTELRNRDLDLLYFLVEDHIEDLKRTIYEFILTELLEGVQDALADEPGEEIEYRQLSGVTMHRVRPDDTLTAIAAEYGITLERLEAVNDVDPRRLQVGDLIVVPEPQPLVIY